MQVGIELGGYWPSNGHHIDNLFPEMLNVVKKGDEIGVDAFIIGEHHFMDYGATPSPIALATHIAPLTSTQKIITSILMLPMHDMPIMAGEIAMADHLTKGRLEIGLARGGGPYEYARAAKPSDIETVREIFDERLAALKLCLTQENVSYKGDYTEFNELTVVPPVLQKPHPPMWLACQRAEAAFHCARNGYHVQTSSLRQPISYVHELVQNFRSGQAESSEPQGKQKISLLQWIYVAKDDRDAREKLEMAYDKQRKFQGIFKNTSQVDGGRVQGVDIDLTLDDLAQGLVIGTRDYVEDRLLEIKETGIDMFAMKTGFGATHADEIASLERLAEHHLPLLKNDEPAAAQS